MKKTHTKKKTAILLGFIDLKHLPGLLLVLAPKKSYSRLPLWEVQNSLKCYPYWTIHTGTCKYKPSKPYKTIKKHNMWRLWAAREYLPASYFFCYSFLNMGPVNLTADEPEVVIWSQCRNQNTQSDVSEWHENIIFTLLGCACTH